MPAVPKVEGEKEGSKHPVQKAVAKTVPRVEEEEEDSRYPVWEDWLTGEEAEQKRLQRAREEQERALKFCVKETLSPSMEKKLQDIFAPSMTAMTDKLQLTDVIYTKKLKDAAELEASSHASSSSKDAADVVATAKSTSE